MIAVRRAGTDEELQLWTRLRNLVATEEPSTVADARAALRRAPETRYWLAEGRGEPAGCAFASFSSVPGCVFVLPRVVPAARGRGVGTALLDAALAYARELGGERARSSTDGADEASLAFAAAHGFAEVDREVELVRPLGPRDAAAAPAPAGIEVERADAERVPELRALVATGAADMPVAGGIGAGFVDDVLDELDEAVLRVVALDAGEPVGVAGLLRYGAREDALEHAFTTVHRSYRGRGIAQALKAECVAFAAANGYRELVTWTQTGNEAMHAVNVAAGFRVGRVAITLEAPLA